MVRWCEAKFKIQQSDKLALKKKRLLNETELFAWTYHASLGRPHLLNREPGFLEISLVRRYLCIWWDLDLNFTKIVCEMSYDFLCMMNQSGGMGCVCVCVCLSLSGGRWVECARYAWVPDFTVRLFIGGLSGCLFSAQFHREELSGAFHLPSSTLHNPRLCWPCLEGN